jgi:hypothetical protein
MPSNPSDDLYRVTLPSPSPTVRTMVTWEKSEKNERSEIDDILQTGIVFFIFYFVFNFFQHRQIIS